MQSLPLRIGIVIIAALFFGACQKKAEAPGTAVAPKKGSSLLAVDVVKESERSRSFAAVSKQLELRGTLHCYIRIDGGLPVPAYEPQGVRGQGAETTPTAA